eukprot:TRINITY_DN21146_c0_g2_i1.p1 TRINITY_DN21146_c0_g2~~TRINITY_DN21146_c0_g2_i1.p1  ORF type:complete len:147 (-),score=40.09 TRINITY_DN21146_c0_g2_i1:144-584(-)
MGLQSPNHALNVHSISALEDVPANAEDDSSAIAKFLDEIFRKQKEGGIEQDEFVSTICRELTELLEYQKQAHDDLSQIEERNLQLEDRCARLEDQRDQMVRDQLSKSHDANYLEQESVKRKKHMVNDHATTPVSYTHLTLPTKRIV